MTTLRCALVASMALVLGLVLPSQNAISATPQLADSADQVVSLRNVTAKEDEVTGEIVNNSKQTVRDVQVQIIYSWRWNNEFHPGSNDPGGAFYQTINTELAPGQSTQFNHKPSSPFASRKDGHFDITVKVVGFTQVYR